MKIAIVIGTLGRGGSERQILEFVRAAHPAHAHCTVVCLGKEGPLAEQTRETGASVIALGGERLASPGVLLSLGRALRRERPDVVYALLFWGYTLALPLATVVVPSASRVQGRRSLPDVDVPRRKLYVGLRRLANLCTDGVIGNSIAVASAAAAAEARLAGKIWVVPNGIGRVQTTLPKRSTDVTIVCVANLIAYKGHATLLEALTRMPSEGWSVLLVGDGPERESLLHAIGTKGLRDRVTLLGGRDDVHALLDSADIAVLPSYSEGMPNSVMEAMAHGLPVVATDVGGNRSLLGSGAGILVPPGDDLALAQALRGLLDNPHARREMGDTGRDLAERALGVDVMRDRTLSAMREIRRASSRNRD
jgi:glycosyltransferase involved in cell wall biosynthesis